MSSPSPYVDFDSLPPVPGQPQGCAWGLWGPDDELGTINYLTPDVVQAAAKEVQVGVSVQLDHRLDFFSQRNAGREPFGHDIIDFKEKLKGTDYEVHCHDDTLSFNTQSSSQWDGLRHASIQETGTYYNGMRHEEVRGDKTSGRLGTQNWVRHGGIVGRGVLLDYYGWREATGQPRIPPDSSYGITPAELEAVAAHQQVALRPGDIVLLRTGYTLWYAAADEAARRDGLARCAFVGLAATMPMVRWLWNHHLAALASDNIGLEQTPVAFHVAGTLRLHDWLLARWGMPIGELWDLETLAQQCRAHRKWSFFFTSAPLHVFGGVASPPNAIAVL